MQKSGKIWKDSSPNYEDALQQTWLWFCKKLCAYDPMKANVITRFNNHLYYRLKPKGTSNVKLDISSIFDGIVAPESDSEKNLWTSVCSWIETDLDGKFKCTHIGDRPDVNAQFVCLERLRGKSWKELATELKSSIPTLNNFWKRQCIPLLDWRIKGDKKPKENKPTFQPIFIDPVQPDGSSIIPDIPAPERVPEKNLLTVVCSWIKNDPDGKFKNTHVRDRPDVNAQVVCLGRLHGKLWRELATELRSSIPVLSGFYRTQCIPLIQELKNIPEIDEFLE
jgi:hypothetical protein